MFLRHSIRSLRPIRALNSPLILTTTVRCLNSSSFLLQRRRGGDRNGSDKSPKNQLEKEKELKEELENEIAEDIIVDMEMTGRRNRSRSNNGSLREMDTSATPDQVRIPSEYPQLLAIPLNKRPLFPGFYKSMYIQDPQTIAAIRALVERRQPYVGIFLSNDDSSTHDTVNNLKDIHPVGVFAQITSIYTAGQDQNALTVVVLPHRRIRATSLVKKPSILDGEPSPEEFDKYSLINRHLTNYNVGLLNVENLHEEPCNADNPMIKAITSEILNVLKEISQINPLLRDQIISFSIRTGGNAFSDPSNLADFIAAVSTPDPRELQDILECLNVEERLHKALLICKKELANAKLQQEIVKEVDKKINRKQQEYYLMEQLKGIKKELGIESDGKDKLVEKFKAKAANLKMPEQVKKVFDEELNKFMGLEQVSAEFNVSRNYLDWLTDLPWGKYSKENFDIPHAKTVLDEDHYEMKDVKDRILEFIAVGKLRGTVEGKIICLSGPPGVGKTSIGKSIARSLGREFFRFSVGGLSDVAEIKGHRRTYVGAMPGKIVQALKKVKTENPLIMIDEIDKLGRGHQGDPASALLELLDPEQNNSFLDHYMDVPIDLSKVLFVCTANVLETIPGPLLDRMEVIPVSGYIAEEKLEIAKRYLAPAAKELAGLKERAVTLLDEAILKLIRQYCRESGVRNLKKHIEKVYRKAALQIIEKEASGETPELIINEENLKSFVGPPVFTSDRLYEVTPPGVVTGLAWTSMGGSVLYMESVVESKGEKGKGSFHQTGQMGEVMKESSMIAYTYSRGFMTQNMPNNDFFDRTIIHLHVPEGATPKDGPSAGVTMTTSLLSLALGKKVKEGIAMTGEMTLTGKVLKIGGVKEKLIAAKRSNIHTVLLPHDNQSDYEELPEAVKEGLKVHFVQWYPEIFGLVFDQ